MYYANDEGYKLTSESEDIGSPDSKNEDEEDWDKFINDIEEEVKEAEEAEDEEYQTTEKEDTDEEKTSTIDTDVEEEKEEEEDTSSVGSLTDPDYEIRSGGRLNRRYNVVDSDDDDNREEATHGMDPSKANKCDEVKPSDNKMTFIATPEGYQTPPSNKVYVKIEQDDEPELPSIKQLLNEAINAPKVTTHIEVQQYEDKDPAHVIEENESSHKQSLCIYRYDGSTEKETLIDDYEEAERDIPSLLAGCQDLTMLFYDTKSETSPDEINTSKKRRRATNADDKESGKPKAKRSRTKRPPKETPNDVKGKENFIPVKAKQPPVWEWDSDDNIDDSDTTGSAIEQIPPTLDVHGKAFGILEVWNRLWDNSGKTREEHHARDYVDSSKQADETGPSPGYE